MLGIAQSIITLTSDELIVPGAAVMKVITLVTELIVVMRIADAVLKTSNTDRAQKIPLQQTD